MVKITQNLVDPSRHALKASYPMTPEFIVVHNTANDASAANEIAYMRRNDLNDSFHFAVDDVQAVQGLPLNRNGWHAGDGANGAGNRKGIGIEICYSKSGGTRFISAEINAAQLIAKLLHERKWGLDKVKKHQDFSGKYCPHRTLDMGWNRFLNMVLAELKKLQTPAPTPTPKPAPSKITYQAITPKVIELVRDANLWNFDFTKWGEARAVKNFKAGEKLEVVAIATNALSAKYYMTEYSFKAKITNGVNVNDCRDYVAPNPVEPPKPEPEPEKPVEPEVPIEPELPEEPTPEPEPVNPSEPGLEIERNNLLKQIVELLNWIVEKVKLIFK